MPEMNRMTNNTKFDTFIADEVKKVKGIYVPVKAGILRRALIRWAPCRKLHPNPEDEFCDPKIGPNYGIVSNYVRLFSEERAHSIHYCDEPLCVQKIRPGGYLILNGHHRWAAALRLGYKWIPVRIVDLTGKAEIQEMLNNSKHDKRVTLDLDEVVFWNGDQTPAEPRLPFPSRNVYKERLRLGIPALFRYFGKKGYDVWVYSAGYYSTDHIQRLFRRYHAPVSGAVTGTGRKTADAANVKKEMEALIGNKYQRTIHIDNSMLLQISRATKEVREFEIGGEPAVWSQKVIEIMENIEKHV